MSILCLVEALTLSKNVFLTQNQRTKESAEDQMSLGVVSAESNFEI